jgi:hypothetical protein
MPLRATAATSAALLTFALSPALADTTSAPSTIEPQDFPAAHLVSNTSGDRCLDVDYGTRLNPRTNVQLFDCRPFSGDPYSDYQIFDRISIPGRPINEFKIRNKATGKCLTYVIGGNPKNVWAERCDLNGQGWRRVNVTGGTQFVAIQGGSLCLDAVDAAGGQRTGIDLFPCNPVRPWNSWRVI